MAITSNFIKIGKLGTMTGEIVTQGLRLGATQPTTHTLTKGCIREYSKFVNSADQMAKILKDATFRTINSICKHRAQVCAAIIT